MGAITQNWACHFDGNTQFGYTSNGVCTQVHTWDRNIGRPSSFSPATRYDDFKLTQEEGLRAAGYEPFDVARTEREAERRGLEYGNRVLGF